MVLALGAASLKPDFQLQVTFPNTGTGEDSSSPLSLTSEPSVPDVGDMKRWRGGIAAGVLTLAVGAVLVFHPWSEPEIPTASKYSSASDLARDLNEHGLGCAHPTRPRLFKLFYRYMAIWVDPRLFLPETLVCSVDGRPVVLSVLRPLAFKAWIRSQSTPRYRDLQDEAAHEGDSLIEALRRDAVLVGPNWMVMGRQERDSIPALSAIRGEIGGTLVVATSPTTPASSPPSKGPSP